MTNNKTFLKMLRTNHECLVLKIATSKFIDGIIIKE